MNKFPQFVRCIVQRLKTLCPSMGKVKIAQTLARAGLHLGATTVRRMLNGEATPPDAHNRAGEIRQAAAIVTAKRPNHVWHVDLTVVPTGAGLWVSWLPFALPQCWPFCWWVAVAVDHFSRRAMGMHGHQEPANIRRRSAPSWADRLPRPEATPKYIVCDRGRQFDCDGFRDWCRRKGIKRPRYGAVGQHGSIAVVERFILTLKCLLSRLLLVPYRRESFQHELDAIAHWYNRHRPHTWLGGKTPDEVYFGHFPANRRPRFEPRSRWPRGSPCAKPWALIRGKPGAQLNLESPSTPGGSTCPSSRFGTRHEYRSLRVSRASSLLAHSRSHRNHSFCRFSKNKPAAALSQRPNGAALFSTLRPVSALPGCFPPHQIGCQWLLDQRLSANTKVN